MKYSGNDVSESLKERLRGLEWGPNNTVDLHELGVHYFDPSFLPSWLDPKTYASLCFRGLTPPNALPLYFGEGTEEEIRTWLEFNYFKLKNGGVHHLGSEFNIPSEEDWSQGEDKLKVCIVRLTEYEIVDGSFGPFAVWNFCKDFSDKILVDFAYLPPFQDLENYLQDFIPVCFGSVTKKPLCDFDIVIISTSFTAEKVNAPLMLSKSGIPLRRWERWDHELPYYNHTPIVCLAGMGGFFAECMMGDHPIKGIGQNGLVDLGIIGEGELVDLKFFTQAHQVLYRDKGTKEDLMQELSNEKHRGIYDPTRVLWEYSDKKHIIKDHKGTVLGEQIYKQGGPIKRVSLIDWETRSKFILAGEGSEEYAQLGEMGNAYLTERGVSRISEEE